MWTDVSVSMHGGAPENCSWMRGVAAQQLFGDPILEAARCAVAVSAVVSWSISQTSPKSTYASSEIKGRWYASLGCGHKGGPMWTERYASYAHDGDAGATSSLYI